MFVAKQALCLLLIVMFSERQLISSIFFDPNQKK